MIICIGCAKRIGEDEIFCRYCGIKNKEACPECGKETDEILSEGRKEVIQELTPD